MASFSKLIRFECEENDDVYFADLGPHARAPPLPKTQLKAYRTIDGLVARNDAETVTIRRLLAPIPREGIPIYCVGLNYRSHAKEVNVDIPKYPPVWTKPATSLAHPGEEIVMQNFCASSLPDYEGELVFVTSKKCREVSVEEAEDFILGYTVGNDLSCRKFQLHSQQAGQFFFAKAFDKFAPIGPMLLSPRLFANSTNLTARVNGEVCQVADFKNDMIFSPKEILSHMSQGTTVPAGTIVMTGTPSGVGVFRKPKRFLSNGDFLEVEMPQIGTLRNKIIFEIDFLTKVVIWVQNIVIRLLL